MQAYFKSRPCLSSAFAVCMPIRTWLKFACSGRSGRVGIAWSMLDQLYSYCERMTCNLYTVCHEAQSHTHYTLGCHEIDRNRDASTHESYEALRYEKEEADCCHESEEEEEGRCDSNETQQEYSCHASEGPEGMRVGLQKDECIEVAETSASSI